MLDGNSYPILTANLIRLGHFPSLNLQGGYSTHGHHWGGLCLLPTLPFSSCSVVVFIPWEKRCSQCDKMHSRLYNIRKTEREGNWAAEREQLEHPSVMACYPWIPFHSWGRLYLSHPHSIRLGLCPSLDLQGCHSILRFLQKTEVMR